MVDTDTVERAVREMHADGREIINSRAVAEHLGLSVDGNTLRSIGHRLRDAEGDLVEARSRGSHRNSYRIIVDDPEVATDGGVTQGRTARFAIHVDTTDGSRLWCAAVEVVTAATDNDLPEAAIVPKKVAVQGSDAEDFVEADLDLGEDVHADTITIEVTDDALRERLFDAAHGAVADHYADVLTEETRYGIEWVDYPGGDEWLVRVRFIDDHEDLEVATDGGTAPGIYSVNATGEMTPLATEDGEGDTELLAEVLADLDDPRPPQERLAAMSEEIRERDSLGEVAFRGGLGYHTFFNPPRTDFGIGIETAMHFALQKTVSEVWLDAGIVEDNQGELSPEAVADEAKLQLEEFVGRRFYDVFRDNLEDALEEWWRDPGQKTLATDGGVPDDAEHYPEGFTSGGGHMLRDDRVGDPTPSIEDMCVDCSNEGHLRCGCCGFRLCGKHHEIQGGFCSRYFETRWSVCVWPEDVYVINMPDHEVLQTPGNGEVYHLPANPSDAETTAPACRPAEDGKVRVPMREVDDDAEICDLCEQRVRDVADREGGED